jgi:hypothetical protein
MGIKLSDFEGHVLNLRRVVYEGAVYDLEPREQRHIPIMDEVLLDRLRNLEAGREWMFESRAGTPVNPNNIRRRFLKPAAQELAQPSQLQTFSGFFALIFVVKRCVFIVAL